MEKDDKLGALIAAGPDRTRGLQNLVLTRFWDISKARAHLRQWGEIAIAMDMPGRGKALSEAFARVRKGVAEKRMEPPTAPADTTRPIAPTVKPKPFPSELSADGEQRPARPGWTHIPIDKPLNK